MGGYSSFKLYIKFAFCLMVFLGLTVKSYALNASDVLLTYEKHNEEQKTFVDKLDIKQGFVTLANGVTLNITKDYYYLSPTDAQKVLSGLWGNPPGNGGLGMIFPANGSPFGTPWSAELFFDNIGYVDDKEASSYKYDELLVTLKADTKLASVQRVKEGYQSVELIGWAAKPYYDDKAKRLYWAKELAFNGEKPHTLNYQMRFLGRKGVFNVNFIANMQDLEAIDQSKEDVLSMVSFSKGESYFDFDPSVDKVAAVGIGGLIAGKVLAKTGLFFSLLLLLKKFWFVLLIPFYFLKNLLRK